MYLVISAVLTLIVIGFMLLSHKLKLPLFLRIVHIRSVLITVAFGIAVVMSFSWILNLLDKFIAVGFIRKLLFAVMPQANTSAAFFWIVTVLSCLFVSAAFYVVMLAARFIWIKPASRSVYLHTKNPVARLFKWIASLCYDTDGEPQVKNAWINVGHWLRVMRNILSVVLIAEAIVVPVYLQLNLTLLNDLLLSKIVKSLYMIPVITWFILDQAVIFLQADSNSGETNLETEDVGISQRGDYSKLIKVYKDIFGDGALISTYINDSVPKPGLFSGPTDAQKKRVENPELLEAVCRSAKNLIDRLPPNFIDAIIDLLNGKSVAVFDSISGEFQLFYLAYLQRNLFLRRKALVICDTEKQIGEIKTQFAEIFKRLNKAHGIWDINDIDSLLLTEDKDTDILVCTEEQLLQNNIENKFPDFFKRLHDVFVINSYDIMCRANPFAFRFYNAIKKDNLQFAFLVPENNRDIDSALEARLGKSDIELYNNFNETSGACLLFWREESFYKTQLAISKDLHNDFGLAYTIALIAIKHGVSRICMHAPESVPLVTYAAAVKYHNSILAKNYFKADNVNPDSVVVHNPIVAFYTKDLSFDIFYDEYNNLLNVAMQALSGCAQKTSMVHIVSRPYMLREYFAYHINTLTRNKNGMQLIVPVYHQDIKAPSVALLVRLRENGMLIEDIISYMEKFGVTGKTIEEVLKIAIEAVFGPDYNPHIYSCFSFGAEEKPVFNGSNYRYTRLVRLTNEYLYDEACRLTDRNIVVTGAHDEVLPIPRSSVYNRFLPGQRCSFGGERYEIIRINDGEIHVISDETVEREKEYTNIYDITCAMLETESANAWDDNNTDYSRTLYKAKVTRSIYGYFEHINGLDFYGDNTIMSKLKDDITETKEVSCLQLKLMFPFNKNHDTAAALFVVLMRGILETALPNNYKDILVVTRLGENAFDESLFDAAPVNAIRRDPIPSDWLASNDDELPLSHNLKRLFPKISNTNFEPNSEKEINLYLIDFSENGSHVLAGIAEDMSRIFNVLYGYLDWIVKNPDMKNCYLRFGYHQIPGIFHQPDVYNCLQRISNYSPEAFSDTQKNLESYDLSEGSRCSFCGRSVEVSSWKFDDDRVMCQECYEHRTTKRREIEILLKLAYSTLESTYGIQLPAGIKVRFKSANSIRKASGSFEGGRILGFYNLNRREIWVERGGPEPCVLSTLMHELTHAWQHENLNMSDMLLMHIEGHSTFVEIECSRLLGQTVFADFWERLVMSTDDAYSQGLLFWKELIRTESDNNIFHHALEMWGL